MGHNSSEGTLALNDDDLCDVLRESHVRLLDADAIRAGRLLWLQRRQELEERERGGSNIFLPSAAAVEAVRAADRRVCCLTHAWRTAGHPDPDGATFGALVHFLRHPLSEHIGGVFVDFACLHQVPRHAAQGSSARQQRPPGFR